MKIIECPRDAMQGLDTFVSTDLKIKYINKLLRVGFDTIDFGSFVSAKAIPQLKDTAIVLDSLDLDNTMTKLLSIVANYKGAEKACSYNKISFVGYPLSISNIFQKRNTNKSIEESFSLVSEMQNLVEKSNKRLVVYLSMAYGNPYGELYDPDMILSFVYRLHNLDIKVISLADTIGTATPELIETSFTSLNKEFDGIEFGAHFHSRPNKWQENITSALNSGCKRFDSAIKGYGGCPMAKDDLTGNMPTERLVSYFSDKLDLNIEEFNKSLQLSESVF